MEEEADNQLKYENYSEQMRRLKIALHRGFFLEAIFIEYAIVEDRLESALRHADAFNPNKQKTITSKLTKIGKLCENKKSLACKYFSPELLTAVRQWKDRRNPLVHELMRRRVTTEDLEAFAIEGESLVKTLKSRVGSFNRASERERAREV